MQSAKKKHSLKQTASLFQSFLPYFRPHRGTMALDLFCAALTTICDIVLPLIAPAIASGMLLAFAMSFDDVIISFFVTGVDSNTLPLKIYSQLKTGVTPEINALCTLIFLVTISLCGLAIFLGREKKPKTPKETTEI